jgi:hypothetical protein
MQYGRGATSDRWALALGAGRGGWSVVVTAPLELLAEPGLSGEHRLGTLARVLGCEALYVSLDDGSAMVVAEARPTGQILLSGYTLNGLNFHGVQLEEERIRPRIESSGVPRSVHAALERHHSDGFDELLAQLADRHWVDVPYALIEGKPVPFARVLSFTRPVLDKKAPLRAKLAVEESPFGTRYVLDEGVWVNGGSIDAANATVGAAFVRKVASWLEVPVTLEPGVPLSSSCIRAAPSESVRRVGVETKLLYIGSAEGADLLLHVARGVGIAELEEYSPYQRQRLVDVLSRALVGSQASADAAYHGFERVLPEPTSQAIGTFAGERLVTAWRQRDKSAIAIEGKEVFELPGLCRAIAGAPGKVAFALVTLEVANERYYSYGQEDATVIIVMDVDTGEMHEVLRSNEHLMLGYTHLCFAGDVLGVQAERDGVPTVVLLDGGKQEERTGDFQQWAREAMRAPPTVDDLYSTDELPMLWAGPDTVVAVEASARASRRTGEGAALVVLDLRTGERRPLFDAAGLKPLACSASGARCLAKVDERRLFVGRRA